MITFEEIIDKFGNVTHHNTKGVIHKKKVNFTESNMNGRKEVHLEFFFVEKVSINGTRRVNPCSIDIRLEETEYEDGIRLTAMANVWNARCTDIERGGQSFDAISQYISNANWSAASVELFNEIRALWEKYHLHGFYSSYKGPITDEDMSRIWSIFNMNEN